MINKRITSIRKKKRMSERELSEMIQMSLTGFRQAMDKDDFKASTLILLSKALEVPIGYFFGDESADVNGSFFQTANGNNIKQNFHNNESKKEILLMKKNLENYKDKVSYLEELMKLKDQIISLLENQNKAVDKNETKT